MLNWNSNRELDRASISNFKAPGLKIQKGNCSKLSFISDGYHFFKVIMEMPYYFLCPIPLNEGKTSRMALPKKGVHASGQGQ